MERLRLERARFELDVADLVMKHIDKLKESGALQLEDRTEAAKKIREQMFGKYTNFIAGEFRAAIRAPFHP